MFPRLNDRAEFLWLTAGKLPNTPFIPLRSEDEKADGLLTLGPHAGGWRRKVSAFKERTIA